MPHETDAEIIEKTHNTPRFFTEHRQIAWVLLLATALWGWYGYSQMPKRKDPDIPVRVAVALCPWPGVDAAQVEQQLTRLIEARIAENSTINPSSPDDFGIKSLSLPGLSIIHVQLAENVVDTKKQFSDINLKLDSLNSQLPQGAGPIQFKSDFGDTAALMLTVASPPVSEIEVALRARIMEQAIKQVRASKADARREGDGRTGSTRLSIIQSVPPSVPLDLLRANVELFNRLAAEDGVLRDTRIFSRPGFMGLDAITDYDDERLLAYGRRFIQERLHQSEIHPDAWPIIVIRDPGEAQAKLAAVAGDKYSYQQLDDFTDLIARTVLGAAQVSKADRSGVLPQQVYLDYSQERLASYGLQVSNLHNVLTARNIALPGGVLEVGRKNITIDPSGQFEHAEDIGSVIVGASSAGSPIYLRDLVDIVRGYQSPPRFLNFYTWRDDAGQWHRSRAVTVAFQMRAGEQIAGFAKSVDAKLEAVKQLLPHDLIMARTSDQPRQVEENVDLFMDALYEAIILVVLISLIGFWEWRSALLMALSIPLTLAMTFGMAHLMGIDLQQVSIASLIIALGLLVDDPVVAGDAIKRGLAHGQPPVIAAWLEPTKLAKAIMYATITNIAAYVPFLLLTGSTGEFIHSLPIVLACSLVASRLVSMTFIPLLGYYLLRPGKPGPSMEERRTRGFTGWYYKVGSAAIQRRWLVFAGSLLFLSLGVFLFSRLKQQFFPEDVQYWSTVDIWLPNDAPLSATNETALKIEGVVRETAAQFGREHPDKQGRPQRVLQSVTTFIGGGGPRFWFSVSPELQQLNYAQLIIQVRDKEDTPELTGRLQQAVSAQVPGARIDVRQLQTNPIDKPIEIRISGLADVSTLREAEDIRTLRQLAGRVEDILRTTPKAARVRNDWGEESATVKLKIDPDRANLAGVTNLDVALSSTAAMSGMSVTTLREGDKQIPVVGRLRMEERARLADIQNLYVYSTTGPQRVPLRQISSVEQAMETERIRRLEHFRTISVQCFPRQGALPSQVLNAALPRLKQFQASLPPGYKMEIGGEYARQKKSFGDLAIVLAISVFAIFLALVMQFNHAVKPLLVFAAVPYGIMGAAIALALMGTPFGFMAFLGIISLVGVIVSHVIVLFDFIEEEHAKGEPFRKAVLDAGIQRLRPVMITVGATVLALFPLALHGGPLWQPLCYAQIGGLTIATFVTLLLVPVLYSIFVLDLKIVKWE